MIKDKRNSKKKITNKKQTKNMIIKIKSYVSDSLQLLFSVFFRLQHPSIIMTTPVPKFKFNKKYQQKTNEKV